MIGLGWYAYKEDMHVTYICYWGMMCLINGVFDLVKLIDHWVKTPFPMFDSSAGFMYNLTSFSFLAIPFVTLAGAYLGYLLYRNHNDGSSEYLTSGSYGNNRRSESTPLWGRSGGNSFTAFGGGGQRLGSA